MMLRLPANFSRRHALAFLDYQAVVVKGSSRHWIEGTAEADVEDFVTGDYWFQPGDQVHQDANPNDEPVTLYLYFGEIRRHFPVNRPVHGEQDGPRHFSREKTPRPTRQSEVENARPRLKQQMVRGVSMRDRDKFAFEARDKPWQKTWGVPDTVPWIEGLWSVRQGSPPRRGPAVLRDRQSRRLSMNRAGAADGATARRVLGERKRRYLRPRRQQPTEIGL